MITSGFVSSWVLAKLRSHHFVCPLSWVAKGTFSAKKQSTAVISPNFARSRYDTHELFGALLSLF